MTSKQISIPDHTAVRVALWRAMHAQIDAKPLVFDDEIGLQLIAPDESWKQRPDMHPQGTRGYRASIVARARFIEDLVQEQLQKGVTQYVILGAGLDSFVQRRPELASKLVVFEIDKPETQAWKQKRLKDLGFTLPSHLKFVPVDFEGGDSWWEKLTQAGFDVNKPAVVASTGVAMYLTPAANLATMQQLSTLAAGSVLAMTFMLPTHLVDTEDQEQYKMVQQRARAAGTPFLSLFQPSEILQLAKQAHFQSVQHISKNDIVKRYFANRTDGLAPSSGEEFLIAKT